MSQASDLHQIILKSWVNEMGQRNRSDMWFGPIFCRDLTLHRCGLASLCSIKLKAMSYLLEPLSHRGVAEPKDFSDLAVEDGRAVLGNLRSGPKTIFSTSKIQKGF